MKKIILLIAIFLSLTIVGALTAKAPYVANVDCIHTTINKTAKTYDIALGCMGTLGRDIRNPVTLCTSLHVCLRDTDKCTYLDGSFYKGHPYYDKFCADYWKKIRRFK